MTRLSVSKTYKLFIGGKFPRSESGRSYQVHSKKGSFVANVSQSSRKDARDSVKAARAAFSGWSNATAYNRGQILYRIAEMLEGRASQFAEEIQALEGGSAAAAKSQVEQAIDLWVWYAGWADKYAQVAGSVNPVAGPYFNLSAPEPTGVVTVVAPQGLSGTLLGFVSVVAPAIVSGNTVVVMASEQAPLPALSFAEVLATSDVPGGVVNVLAGSPEEVMPWLAAHADVNAVDLAGAGELNWQEFERAAADTLKRVLPPIHQDHVEGSLDRITGLIEIKTVWHTKAVI